MARVACQARIVNPSHLGMILQKFCNLQCTPILILNSYSKRLHPTVEQETSIWIEGATQMVQLTLNQVNQVRATDYGTRYNVRIPIEVLGTAMERQIKSEFRRYHGSTALSVASIELEAAAAYPPSFTIARILQCFGRDQASFLQAGLSDTSVQPFSPRT